MRPSHVTTPSTGLGSGTAAAQEDDSEHEADMAIIAALLFFASLLPHELGACFRPRAPSSGSPSPDQLAR
jgi:hypothetical protein